jgi:hypothetical protein
LGYPSLKMTEVEILRDHLAEGFQAVMILRNVSHEEARRAGLPDAASAGVKALPLAHADGRKVMFYLIEAESIEFAESIVRDLRSITGYTLVICCCVMGTDTVEGRTVSLDGIISGLRDMLGWQVRASDTPYAFDVIFEFEGEVREQIDAAVKAVRTACLALSLRNRIGFFGGSSAAVPKFKGQPFSIVAGHPIRVGLEIDREDLSRAERISNNDRALACALALQAIYSGVTDDLKLTIGWAAIEEFFGSSPEHLLDVPELEAVAAAIDSLQCLASEKRDTLKKKLKDPNYFSKQSRNERIATTIATLLLGSERDAVLRQIRDITSARGKRVHTFGRSQDDLRQHLKFIESVLLAGCNRAS